MTTEREIQRSTRLLGAALPLAALLLCGAGCAVQEPATRLEKARLTGLSFTEMDVELGFKVDNPNSFELPVAHVDWNLELFDGPFAEGVAQIAKTLPAQGELGFDVPVTITLARAAQSAKRILDGKPLAWRLTGAVAFDSPFGVISVDFDRDGTWKNPLQPFGLLWQAIREGAVAQATPSAP